MQYWLIKSEPECYSIDDLKRDRKTAWTGIRNYQARNFMRDGMKLGDGVLFYHSSTVSKGVVGIAKVVSAPYPDVTALDKTDDHFDPKASKENPIWFCVDMAFVKKLKNPVSLLDIKTRDELREMLLIQRGSRLSVQPVSEQNFKRIVELGEV